MTKNIVLSVRNDVSAQMQLIQEMAHEVEALHKEAEGKNDENLRRLARHMAAKLNALSQKAYSVGEKVLDAA